MTKIIFYPVSNHYLCSYIYPHLYNIMSRTSIIQYQALDLSGLIIALEKDYYSLLEELCQKATGFSLKHPNDYETTEIYTNLCIGIIEQIKQIVEERKKVIIPYMNELAEKSSIGHDCQNCSGGCKVNHSFHLKQLEDSHYSVREMLHRLQKLAIPLYSEEHYSNAYRSLRNEMLLIDTTISEMFFIEESLLIPKMFDAKTKINASA